MLCYAFDNHRQYCTDWHGKWVHNRTATPCNLIRLLLCVALCIDSTESLRTQSTTIDKNPAFNGCLVITAIVYACICLNKIVLTYTREKNLGTHRNVIVIADILIHMINEIKNNQEFFTVVFLYDILGATLEAKNILPHELTRPLFATWLTSMQWHWLID